jgi:hypothetical protein
MQKGKLISENRDFAEKQDLLIEKQDSLNSEVKRLRGTKKNRPLTERECYICAVLSQWIYYDGTDVTKPTVAELPAALRDGLKHIHTLGPTENAMQDLQKSQTQSNGGGIQFGVFEHDSLTYVVFKGTTNIDDWTTNLNYRSITPYFNAGDKVGVHAGMHSSVTQVDSDMNGRSVRSIIFRQTKRIWKHRGYSLWSLIGWWLCFYNGSRVDSFWEQSC